MVIRLSGEYGEGGGSIIRIALALSTLTGQAFEVDNIRKGRPKSGLKAQHIYCIKGTQQLCDAKVEGMEIGSEYLKFEPSKLKSKDLKIDIGTAGSITLVLQTLLLPSIFGDKKIKIELIGGSDCNWSPSFDYFNNVFLPQIQKYADIECKLIKRGYYPKGNGKVEIKIKPKYKISDFKDFNDLFPYLKEKAPKIKLIEQGHLIQIKGISHASLDLQNANVAERQAKSAEIALKNYNCPINIQIQYNKTLSTGSGITLWVIFSKNKDEIDLQNPVRLGGDALGERGKKAEKVGIEAAQTLTSEIRSRSPVDVHLADQLVPIMGVIPNSKIRVSSITNHCKTNIWVTEKFLPIKFNIKNQLIECFEI
ncbi:MAG: RNA 3'-terminal phosphate cyclase [Acidobacteria bacterium]|nr:RNA 3'-terminal phosphate cyclase [Acidobacteriota bacterium]|tara:strand:- start:14943 stop:16040 length:1098 start_codon:yes stop_codon:yes gene_type:complete